ncbi:MAG: Flagellar protein FlaG protein [uncultured bacterium]|nr:MAG: Flagellar protein FlaG protein [uncultured bacterium]
MISETMNITGTTLQKMPRASEQIDSSRKDVKEEPNKNQGSADKKNVQTEELLSKIKALTENGLYSVRFENDERSKELIVKIVDSETQEVIRQVPAEELLGMKAALAELQGNLVDTKS